MKIASVLPHWQDVPADAFVAEFPATTMVGVNLDQRSAAQLKSCIIPWDDGKSGELAWAGNLARDIYARGRNVLWTVPFPGALQMERVKDGDYDDLYIAIAYQQIAAMKAGGWTDDCWTRFGHEHNLWGNTEQRALDKNGKPNAELFKRCYRHVTGLMQRVFTREQRPLKLAFSPSVERHVVVDWELTYPGKAFVDAILPDLYMCTNFGHKPGVYIDNWFREPLLRLRAFAEKKAIPFGLGETGIDDDVMAPDFDMALGDVLDCASGWAIIQYWNDWQVTPCEMDRGKQPATAATWKRRVERALIARPSA